jgi:ParB family chromosome partitioning protein
MARRSGLGQRGLDILIPERNAGGTKKDTAEKNDKNKRLKKSGAELVNEKDGAAKDTEESETAETAENAGKDVIAVEESESNRSGQLEVDINLVEPNRDQPRKRFDEDALQELSDSIKVHGVIQPLIVQMRDGYYEIIAGERRWRAARLAGLKTVPVLVRDYSDRDIMELSLIENIQRQDLNPIEEASAYKRLIDEYQLTQDEVAERVSRSRASVTNSLRLLKLDERVQNMLISEMLSTGHVRALLAIEDRDLQYQIAQKAFDEKWSVREVENYVRKLQKKPVPEKKPVISQQLQIIYQDMEEKMRTSLGTKVSIQSKNPEKGRIEIEYFSSDELERVYHAILNSDES